MGSEEENQGVWKHYERLSKVNPSVWKARCIYCMRILTLGTTKAIAHVGGEAKMGIDTCKGPSNESYETDASFTLARQQMREHRARCLDLRRKEHDHAFFHGCVTI